MTQTELELLVAQVRTMVEDLVSAVNRRFYMNDGSVFPDDGIMEVPGTPWASIEEVLSIIPIGLRSAYLTVNVAGVEYWFLPNGDLVRKVGDLSISNGAVTPAKMANVDSGTVFYKKTPGIGPPEVQTLDTLREDLNIPSNVDLSDYVRGRTGYSLVQDVLINLIHEPGSDDQDLSGKVDNVEGSRLITEAEVALISATTKPFTISLPASSTVEGRLVGLIEGTNYPTGWVLAINAPGGLSITHNLGKNVIAVNVFSSDLNGKRLEKGSAAYIGLLSPDQNVLIIEGLAIVQKPIDIYIQVV